ncbi:MAG: hypothetical protein SGJ02_12925 [bacterium]|nr:hypothetical protein [bacterium]
MISDENFQQNISIIDGVVKTDSALVVEALNEAFKRNRDFLVHELSRRFSEINTAVPSQIESNEWIEVDSLSKLRGLVGGRFETLKARWQAAGFPLKRKKGDKISDYQVEENGWLELEGWIAKQGFRARRRSDKEECLFELLKN